MGTEAEPAVAEAEEAGDDTTTVHADSGGTTSGGGISTPAPLNPGDPSSVDEQLGSLLAQSGTLSSTGRLKLTPEQYHAVQQELIKRRLIPIGHSKFSGKPVYYGDHVINSPCMACHAMTYWGTDVIPDWNVDDYKYYRNVSRKTLVVVQVVTSAGTVASLGTAAARGLGALSLSVPGTGTAMLALDGSAALAAEGFVVTLDTGTIVIVSGSGALAAEGALVYNSGFLDPDSVSSAPLDGGATATDNAFPTHPGGTGAAYNEATGQGVYILRDSTGRIRYVGRGDAPKRLLEHLKPGSGKEDLVGEILFNNNLPAAQARSIEQELMQMLGGPKSVNSSTSLRNLIQGIGEGNPNFVNLEFAADDDLIIEALRRAGLLGR